MLKNVKGQPVALPANSKVTIEDAPKDALAVVDEGKTQYQAKLSAAFPRDRLQRSKTTLRVELDAEVLLSCPIRLEHYAGYKSLKYRLQPGASEDFEELVYPNKPSHIKAGPQSSLELRVTYNVSASPSNVYLVFGHLQKPGMQVVAHIDPLKGSVRVNFTNAESFKHLNGEYSLAIFSEFSGATVPVQRWFAPLLVTM